MLQTLTDISDEEVNTIVQPSIDRIKNICNSRETMMDILGITPYNTNMIPFQKAIKIYPALLGDTYSKDILRETKNSLLKKYRSGKIEVKGKYAFILPDFYAACEYWFMGIKEPKGLLNDGEVFCWLTRFVEKVDCLRSPHLYREHPVRKNVAHKTYGDRSEEIHSWFNTNGIYTSTHDLITKIVMADCDGDKLLVVSDSTLVNIAERNMKDIVPLYYNMRKALPSNLSQQDIYNGLIAAFNWGNIGVYSNNISKIWNSDIFINGTEKEKSDALDVIKLITMENNYSIDAAKTLYMPERSEWFSERLAEFAKNKLPAFFEFAKDKEKKQINARNNSFVNKIHMRIPNSPINTRKLNLGVIDYRLMMSNPYVICDKDVADLYDKLNRQYRYMLNMKDEYVANLRYVACRIRDEFSSIGYSSEMITDMLVQYLYGGDKRYKQVLWFGYGQHIVNNLTKNILIPKTKFIQCVDCGEWIEVATSSRTIRCTDCITVANKQRYIKYNKKRKK